MKKKIILVTAFLLLVSNLVGQNVSNDFDRINKLQAKLNNLSNTIPGLSKTVDINITDANLPVFINTMANTHQVNISVDQELFNQKVSYNFSETTVKNVLLHLCKEYSYTIDNVGNILTLKKHIPVVVSVQKEQRIIPVSYDASQDKFSVELQNDSISKAFKRITDVTGKNLVYASGLGNRMLTGYIKEKSLESALDKLAFSNNLEVIKTKDDYYLFQGLEASNANIKGSSNGKRPRIKPRRYSKSNFYYQVKDTLRKVVEVDFENADISSVIKDIGHDLKIDIFTSAPLNNLGKASIKSESITYDWLLFKLLEDTNFTFKKEDNLYIFGSNDKVSLNTVEIIPLMHRSIEAMSTLTSTRNNNFSNAINSITQGTIGNQGFQNSGVNSNFNNRNFQNNNNFGQNQSFGGNTGRNGFDNQNRRGIQQRGISSQSNNSGEQVNAMFPKYVTGGLDIKVDRERNSFIVSGDPQEINRLKTFIKEIDKPIPVILIEVMILEVSKSATLNTGVELGIGDKPVTDQGKLFPSGDITLGATTINKIIGGFNGFGSLNVGKVVPNFYARIQAMESNGNIKIRSTPKLATLNGHEAILSNGERSYYAITRRDIIGAQNPQTTEIRNYVPIDADLSIAIKPMVAGDDQITMSINVVQSSFNGKRIEEDAPPGMNSREFNSIIRVKNNDVVILGGLEENLKNDSGSGVPFLARIPIIKWFFSKKTRIDSKKKLSVLIKPTIIK